MGKTIPFMGKKSRPKLIEGDDQARAQKCLQGIRTLCDQWDCLLVPKTTIIGNKIAAFDVAVVPKPRLPEKGHADNVA